jgi:cyclophilin family peptidyl-prolyl cis-trans isomerase
MWEKPRRDVCMTKKKLVKKTKAAQPDRTVQYIAGALIALVALFFLVKYVPWNSNSPKTYAAPPPMTIDPAKKYLAAIEMETGGGITIELLPGQAPITVNSFVFLAREGFYDGTTFHRVLEGFMAQGGDPLGSGAGGPGYEFVNEDSDLTFDKAGVVAMANSGRDTNGSQFFITFGPAEFLNGGYTIFGQVVEGMDVVNGITLRDPDANPDFEGDKIKTVTITEE